MPISSRARRKRWSRRKKKSARRRSARKAKIAEALERLKGRNSVVPAERQRGRDLRRLSKAGIRSPPARGRQELIDPNNRPGGPNLILTAKSANKIQFFDAATLAKTAEIDMPALHP